MHSLPQRPRRLRIAIADAHTLTADSLFAVLRQDLKDCELAGHASGASEAVALCREMKPQILLADSAVAEQRGAEFVLQVKGVSPMTHILFYAARVRSGEVYATVRSGAGGFVEKSCGRAEFVQALSRVAKGEVYLCSRSIAELVHAIRHRESDEERSGLTRRESEILSLIAAGESSKEIARRLSIGASTVESHRANLMAKVGARNVAQLVQYGFRRGLLAG